MALTSRVRQRLGVAMRVGLVAFAALSLGACARQVGSDSFGDVKPHPGVASAHGLPIHGVDVSRWQKRIDWASVAASGKRFAFIKATEGGDHVDPMFLQNWEGARQAGVARGAYHFMFWCRSADDQAAWFRKVVPQDPSALPPVLDVEWNGESRTCPGKLSRPKALAMIQTMLRAMQAHTGKRPIIYTDITFHEDVLEGELPDYAHWIRSTAAEPHVRYKNRTWTIWQYTTTGRVPGIAGAVDRNAFYGSESDWAAFIRGGCDARFGCS